MSCGFSGSFTCQQECQRLVNNPQAAVKLPANISCDERGKTLLAATYVMHFLPLALRLRVPALKMLTFLLVQNADKA